MKASLVVSSFALLSLVAAGCSDASSLDDGANAGAPNGVDGPNAGGDGGVPTPNTNTDGGPPVSTEPKKADVFVAVGHMGRSVMSCDDGATWIHDQSEKDDARCWVDGDPNYVECDHTAFSSPAGGVAFGDGRFYASYGWGYDGSVRRSSDGWHWETVKTDGWGGGVAFAKKTVFTLWEGQWFTSTDQGGTWTPVVYAGKDNLDHAFPRGVGDRLFALGRANGAVKGAISTDSGATWTTATGLGQDTAKHIAEGNNVLVSIGDNGVSARSTDGGMTWASKQVVTEGSWTTALVFDGTAFVAWAGSTKWSSPDGVTWSSAPVTGVPPWWSAAVSFNPKTKTYVAVLNAWGNYYDKQKAYRSADGLTWTTLDAAHFKGGHPISNIVLGQVDPSVCQ
jgi:hypothetical protein